MDFNNLAIQGVSLIALVFGLVEFFKSLFNMSGKAVTALSMAMGVVVMTAFQLIPLLAQPYETIVNVAVLSITFGLAASGFYKFTNARLPTPKE
jgi:hypothetical protein